MPHYLPPTAQLFVDKKIGMYDEEIKDWTNEGWKQNIIVTNKQCEVVFRLGELRQTLSQDKYVKLLNGITKLLNKASKYEVPQK